MDDQRHVALPKLYGAPAYARPPVVPANPVPRPIDPDDLPLIAEMTPDDLEGLQGLQGPEGLEGGIGGTEPAGVVAEPAPPDAVGDVTSPGVTPPVEIQSRPFSIRDVAQRFRGSRP